MYSSTGEKSLKILEYSIIPVIFLSILLIRPSTPQYGYGGPGISYGTYNNWCNNFGNNNISFATNNSVVNDVENNMASVTNTNNLNTNNNFNYSFYFYGPLCTFYDNIVYPQPLPPPAYPQYQQPAVNYVYIPPAPEPRPQPEPEVKEEPVYEEEQPAYDAGYAPPSPYIPLGSPPEYTIFNGQYADNYAQPNYQPQGFYR